MNFVLDASVTLAWCFDDEGAEYAKAVLEELRHSEAVAAPLWPVEVTNGLLEAERRGRLAFDDARRFLRLLGALPIVVEPVSRSRTFDVTHRLARTHRLTAYDAAYLELAGRLGVPIATLDGALGEAARAEGVGVFGEA